MSKAKVMQEYLANLETIYAGRVDYPQGSRSRAMAIEAATNALAGKIRLEGDAWFKALATVGLDKRSTRAEIAALEE